MKTQRQCGAAIACLLVLAGCTSPEHSPTGNRSAEETITTAARVVRVIDGDTIRATWDGAEHKIRLLGVDAPEVAHRDYGKPTGEPCGIEATKLTKTLVEGKTVSLIRDTSQEPTDKYGRTLAYVEIGGTDVSAALLKAGLAEQYRAARSIDRYSDYRELAATAPTPACAAGH